jgi:hypothetical protein
MWWQVIAAALHGYVFVDAAVIWPEDGAVRKWCHATPTGDHCFFLPWSRCELHGPKGIGK